ncbi:hypothetical protein C8Q80DRAFT_127996 [Daedaleopsis nitida]|nr:hypothetical protein C8Q80DRAFT_127996 [Daedaleopsis nitida]
MILFVPTRERAMPVRPVCNLSASPSPQPAVRTRAALPALLRHVNIMSPSRPGKPYLRHGAPRVRQSQMVRSGSDQASVPPLSAQPSTVAPAAIHKSSLWRSAWPSPANPTSVFLPSNGKYSCLPVTWTRIYICDDRTRHSSTAPQRAATLPRYLRANTKPPASF